MTHPKPITIPQVSHHGTLDGYWAGLQYPDRLLVIVFEGEYKPVYFETNDEAYDIAEGQCERIRQGLEINSGWGVFPA